MSLADAFEPLRFALEQAGIRFAIGGSWASTAFGEPRFTNDVDIVADFTEKTLSRLSPICPNSFTWMLKKPWRQSAAGDRSRWSAEGDEVPQRCRSRVMLTNVRGT